MNIDSHQHFWKYNPSAHGWITPEMAVIRNDFLPQDLESILERNAIDGCVAVQVDQTESETNYLLGLAEQHSFIKGVVGWIDFCGDHLPQRLQHYSRFEKLKGFRHIVQAEPEDFLRNPDFIEGVRQLGPYGFTYDILIYPHQLEAAIYFVSQLPGVTFVLDHLAKPYISRQEIEPWATGIKTLASFPNVYCKVSGMVTEANLTAWKYEDFIPYLDVVFSAFGTQRLMFGSDWPVCLLAADYASVKKILSTYLNTHSEEVRDAVFGKNACDVYRLRQ